MSDASFALHGPFRVVKPIYVADPRWRGYRVTVSLSVDGLEIAGLRGERFVLFVTLKLPDYGCVSIPVDGEGEGLEPGSHQLAVELLRSRAARAVRHRRRPGLPGG